MAHKNEEHPLLDELLAEAGYTLEGLVADNWQSVEDLAALAPALAREVLALRKDNDAIHELAAHYREQLAEQKAAGGVH